MSKRSILEDAHDLTHGERQAAYGPPEDDYRRVTMAFNALTGHNLSPAEGAVFMCCVKLARESHVPQRDNRVDLAGYAFVLDRCREAE